MSGEHSRERLVEVFVVPCTRAHVGKQVRRQDVEALFDDRFALSRLGRRRRSALRSQSLEYQPCAPDSFR